jgi:hypothetical protein
MDSTEASTPEQDEYYVLKEGKIVGPYTKEQLRADINAGRLKQTDFVQTGGLPIWRPLGRVLGEGFEELAGAVAPDWRSLVTWAWLRLRYNLDEQSIGAGLTTLGIGIVALALARWPFVFWAPWFIFAAIAGFALLRRGRSMLGFFFLLAVVATPFLFSLLEPAKKVQTPTGEKPESDTGTLLAVATPRPAPPVPIEVPPEGDDKVSATPAPLPTPAVEKRTVSVPPVATPPAAPPAPATPAQASPDEATESPKEPGFLQRATAAISKAFQRPAEATPTPSAAAPVSSSSSAATPSPEVPAVGGGDFVHKYSGALVLVGGREGSGSGFVCRMDGKTWLLTNAHVAADIKVPQFSTLNRTAITPGAIAAAVGHDIIRFEVANPPPQCFEILHNIENNARIGDEVAVLGNSGGGGVVTSLKGEIVGIGPDRVEVSAEFIPGNSGSPIIHVKSGKVIGIATYLTRHYDEFGGGGKSPPNSTPSPKPGPDGTAVIRHFGYRLDSVAKWEPVNWALFQADSGRIRKIAELTEDIFDFLGALRKKQAPHFETDALRRPATEWMNMINRAHVSEADRAAATRSFIGALRSLVRMDVNAAEMQIRYSYFREELKSEREVRDKLFAAFDAQAKRLASPTERPGF